MNEEMAARSERRAARHEVSLARKGGKAGSYDDWSVADLKSGQTGCTGYSGLTKDKLIS